MRKVMLGLIAIVIATAVHFMVQLNNRANELLEECRKFRPGEAVEVNQSVGVVIQDSMVDDKCYYRIRYQHGIEAPITDVIPESMVKKAKPGW